MAVEDEHLDLLQNLEFGIVGEYRRDHSLLDLDARDAVEALIRHYQAEEQQRTPPPRRLGERAERVFRVVHEICEWRLGRPSGLPGLEASRTSAPRTPEVLVLCLKRIRKSIDFWNKKAGRQGYLSFVSQHVG